MGLKAAVFCHNGLGDGVNCLVLSNNLHLNGWKVDTYQNTVGSMQNWFPHLPVFSYPGISECSRILNSYDMFFVVQNDTYPFVLQLIEEGKRRFPDRMKVIYLYPSPNIVNEPYYADCLTEYNLPVAENLRRLCEKVIHLPKSTKSNGFIPPEGLVHRKHMKRVLFHPTSAKLSRNWPKDKYVKLALHLKYQGYEPVFLPGQKEGWEDIDFPVMTFPHLDQLSRYIYESGYLIGNDSGLGHLASALHVPTLTFCRGKRLAQLWGPSFTKGVILTPSSLVPNIKGLRLRDQYWKEWISVNKAINGFYKLVHISS